MIILIDMSNKLPNSAPRISQSKSVAKSFINSLTFRDNINVFAYSDYVKPYGNIMVKG